METKSTSTLSSPVHVQHYLSSLISFEREEFWALAINNQLELIKAECLFRGTVNECPIYPRDIFRFACITNASGLILCHSHPSGSPKPSGEDIKVTRQILRAAKLLKIPIQDHVILTKDSLYSFRLDGKI